MVASFESPVLVTGASGMLGRHVVDALLEAGHAVRAFVRESSDAQHLHRPGVELAFGHARDEQAIRRAVQGASLIFHLAGYLTVGAPFGTGEASPQYQVVNVAFTERLLAAGLASGARRFLLASSNSVYAPDAPVPTPEHAPLGPTSPYGRSKLAAEERVGAYGEKGLAPTIVRPAVIYGPGDRYFTPAALRLARLPLLPLVHGGRALFDMVYARDVAELLVQAAQTEAAAGRVYNAGPGGKTTLRGLVAAYRRLTGRGPLIVPVSPAVARRMSGVGRMFLARLAPGAEAALTPHGLALMEQDLHLAMGRAREELGYRPRFTLEEGLRETLKHFA